jgi:hypothetical protein
MMFGVLGAEYSEELCESNARFLCKSRMRFTWNTLARCYHIFPGSQRMFHVKHISGLEIDAMPPFQRSVSRETLTRYSVAPVSLGRNSR